MLSITVGAGKNIKCIFLLTYHVIFDLLIKICVLPVCHTIRVNNYMLMEILEIKIPK